MIRKYLENRFVMTDSASSSLFDVLRLESVRTLIAGMYSYVTDSMSVAAINRLDDKTLAEIFTYLPIDEKLNIEKVCKRWRRVGKTAWHNVKFLKIRQDLMNQNYVESLLVRCGQYLESLKVESNYQSNILPIICEHCHNLTHLSLDLGAYYDKHFEEAFAGMRRMRSISITGMDHIPLSLLLAIQNLPKEVEEIRLHRDGNPTHGTGEPRFSPYDSLPTFERFDFLRSLSIMSCKLKMNVMKAISQKEKLMDLSLLSCTFESKECIGLISRLKNLRDLDLENAASQLDDNMIAGFVDGCPHLRYLNLHGESGLTNHGVSELTKLENLEEVVLNSASNNIGTSISKFSHLKIIDCSYIPIGDSEVIELLNNSPNIKWLFAVDTKISIETLVNAATITRRRTNDVILNIVVNHDLVKDVKAPKYLSPFLIIHRHNPIFRGRMKCRREYVSRKLKLFKD